jgi:hypothetical protein
MSSTGNERRGRRINFSRLSRESEEPVDLERKTSHPLPYLVFEFVADGYLEWTFDGWGKLLEDNQERIKEIIEWSWRWQRIPPSVSTHANTMPRA